MTNPLAQMPLIPHKSRTHPIFPLMRTILNKASAFLLLCFTANAAEEVTIYSYRHYEADQKLYEQFTAETGIKVNTLKAKADALIARIKAEGDKCPADLFIAADVGRLIKAQDDGILQPATSELIKKQVPESLRDSEDFWTAFTVRARVIVYAKDRVKAGEITSYEDLTKPEWKGRVIARSSSNIYNQSLMASFIAKHGEQKAYLWARGVRMNMAREPEGSDRDQMRAVAAGIADACIVNTYYMGLLVNSADEKDHAVAEKLAICFPNQAGVGTHINISGGGVCKYAPNKENAVKLLEFLTAANAQSVFSETTSEYPLVRENATSELLKSWGLFKADPLKLEVIGKHRKAAAKAFLKAGWK
jgi:iron(III) transport system substrate-binding protein